MHSSPAPASTDGPHHQVIARLVGRSQGTVGQSSRQLWERLSLGLVALIGQEGFKALFERSLHLAGARFAWLNSAHTAGSEDDRLQALESVLQSRNPEESMHAAVVLLSTFTGLLSTLIGQNLTTNILRAAWGEAFDAAVQEVSQWPTK